MTATLDVTTSPVPEIKGADGEVRTAGIVVDGHGNLFHKTSMELVLDGQLQVVFLDATKVELILKLLGVAPDG